MGMYTELIFGAAIKNDPKVVDIIQYMLDKDNKDKPLPEGWPFGDKENRIHWMFNSGGSSYFGAYSPDVKFEYDEAGEYWRLNARFNIKNYSREIDVFLAWIKPYIESGSGSNDMYAIKIYEEDEEPTIYYLNMKTKTKWKFKVGDRVRVDFLKGVNTGTIMARLPEYQEPFAPYHRYTERYLVAMDSDFEFVDSELDATSQLVFTETCLKHEYEL